MRPGVLAIGALALVTLAGAGVGRLSYGDANPNSRVQSAGNEPLQPIRRAKGLDGERVRLGRDLFHDRRLSGDNSISCASCHDLARGGADGMPVSIGIRGQAGPINSPTVLNAALNFRQFWNGRAASLEEQVDGPIQSAAEMGSSWPEVVRKLGAVPDYRRRFGALYRDGVTPSNVRDAIATFERSLVTPSRFDRYLLGDSTAITDRERRGYAIFKSYGCVSCHQGANVGGNMYQVFGVIDDYFAARGNLTAADDGRFAVTHDERDRRVFKVPSLRNVALTAPYFHDGATVNLPIAVRVMAQYQLGRTLTPPEIALLVAFLGSLTGEVPAEAFPPAATTTPPAAVANAPGDSKAR